MIEWEISKSNTHRALHRQLADIQMQEPSYPELKVICTDLNRRLRFLEDKVVDLESKLSGHVEACRHLHHNQKEPLYVERVIKYTKEQIVALKPQATSSPAGNGEAYDTPSYIKEDSLIDSLQDMSMGDFPEIGIPSPPR